MGFWRNLALAASVTFPAVAISAGVAAVGHDWPSILPAAARGATVLAQDTTQTPAEEPVAVPEDAAAEETAGDEEAAAEEDGAAEEPAVFTEDYLHDPANIEAGMVVWEVCAGCHGSRAYPGKAPKLRPSRYTPDYVFDRVTNGFKKMPAWKDVFTKEERMAVTAWILSDDFTP